MSNPKISIIIPVYNVKEYLAECLDSIINQTLQEIEIICVNDGSTDNSLQILEEYARKDTRIKIINISNRGCGYARKIALKEARGEYILFCDSDDKYANNDVFYEIYSKMKETNVDLLLFDFYWIKEDKKEYKNCLVSDKDIFTYKDIYYGYIHVAPWMKCQKKSFLDKYNDWYFPEKNVTGGDNPLHYQLLIRAESITLINKPCYIHYSRSNSLQMKKWTEKELQEYCIHIQAINQLIHNECDAIEIKKNIVYLLLNTFYNHCLYKYYQNLSMISEETAKLIKITYEEINKIIKDIDFSDFLYHDNLMYQEAVIFFKVVLSLSVENLTKYFNNTIYRKKLKQQTQANKIQAQANKIQAQANKIQAQQLTIKQLQHSKSYRIGRLIIAPLSIPLKVYRLIRDYNLLKKSDLFDTEYYLAKNEDVQKQKKNPILHYLRFGWKEGRNPSEQFDSKAYLNQRPDVKVAGICPLVHYIKFGKK